MLVSSLFTKFSLSKKASSSQTLNCDNKIALFLPSLNGGGAQRIMVYLANGFAERGFQVDLVLANAEGPYLPLVKKNVQIVDLNCSRVIASLPGLIRYLRIEKPDVILSALEHANIVSLLARRISGVKTRVVISIHNTVSSSLRKQKLQRARLLPLFMRWFYPWANQVVGVSEGVTEDFIKAVPCVSRHKVKVIYNPVVTDELLLKAEENLDHPWFAPEEPPVILGIGRLTEQKDFTTLIHAFKLLSQQCSARLMILGEGEEKPALESLVKQLGLEDRLSLPGFVNNPFQYMKKAAVFVLSSRWEGLPTVLIEAMACGTPVISTDCPNGPKEILESGKWGKLVPVGDVEALSQAILASLNSKTHSPPMEILEKRFGASNSIDQYLSILTHHKEFT